MPIPLAGLLIYGWLAKKKIQEMGTTSPPPAVTTAHRTAPTPAPTVAPAPVPAPAAAKVLAEPTPVPSPPTPAPPSRGQATLRAVVERRAKVGMQKLSATSFVVFDNGRGTPSRRERLVDGQEAAEALMQAWRAEITTDDLKDGSAPNPR